MAWQDDVAEKRRESAALSATQNSHKESLDAVANSGKGVVSATDKLAKSQDIDSLIKEVKELQLASLLGASKPSIILTDQTDLGDKIAELKNALVAAVEEGNVKGLNGEQLQTLQELVTAVKGITIPKYDDSKLLAAVKALKLSTVVNVPDPKVTIQERKIDFKPLIDALKPVVVEELEEIDLSCYRAQDIDNSPDKQYVGFVNPDGNWYIIENMVKENKLRYVFGVSGYAKAFANAAGYEYHLLNEALDALQA